MDPAGAEAQQLATDQRPRVIRRRAVAVARRAAVDALEARGIGTRSLVLLEHGENTTFRAALERRLDGAVGPADVATEVLVRVHRPGKHGPDVRLAADAVRAELAWLEALRRDTSLLVPRPVASADGATVVVTDSGGARVVSLLGWQSGRRVPRREQAGRVGELGLVTARLHEHARGWVGAAACTGARRGWDPDVLFGDGIQFDDGTTPARVRRDLGGRHRTVVEAVVARATARWAELASIPGSTALVHADLHFDNVLAPLRRTDAPGLRVIDFDDCGPSLLAYDAAVALWELRVRDDWPALRDRYLEGYVAGAADTAADHVVEAVTGPDLDLLLAAREVSYVLWVAGTAARQGTSRTGVLAALDEAVAFITGILDLPGLS